MPARVVDPAGASWSVRRRWYPWRRALSFREALAHEPSAPEEEQTEDAEDTAEHGIVVQVVLAVLGVLLWIVWTAGRIIFYTGVIAVFVVISMIELVLQLAVMPVVLLLRVTGIARWPVQIDRAGKHVQTRHADGYGAAAALCDEARAEIERGALPVPEAATAE
ncbi:hypothetical protein [Mycolicibacterium sediminis]|uniref:Uncharacterized protein n=1 Tax=Mycolicibacterium sediminis TaxID=1286180 RepID=A0A7I7QLA9_9MYCO|nr:hypothetical protein [Mycolicibacterium sediminis]BBY26656.1 hypothetical protein MSEDJ_07520 [Mycolicibacterium sediminis]